MTEHLEPDHIDKFIAHFRRDDAYVPYEKQRIGSDTDQLILTFLKKEFHAGVHHQNTVFRRLAPLPVRVMAERFAKFAVTENKRDALRVGLTLASLVAARDHRGMTDIFRTYHTAAEALTVPPRQLFIDVASRVSPSAGESLRAFIYDDGSEPPVTETNIDRNANTETYPVDDTPTGTT